MRVKEIIIYPIKSLGGISVETAQAHSLGFHNDRRIMLIDQDGTFITQRMFPQLALIKPSISNQEIALQYKTQNICININSDLSADSKQVTVWDATMNAATFRPEINNWFSEILNKEVKLAYYSDSTKRTKHFDKDPGSTGVSFADGYPYLMLGTASMDLLNSKLENDLDINRFRANIIIESKEAHIEDDFNKIKIGEAAFLNIKPCKRCVMTTIDQSTAEKSVEPLKTLNTYRKFDKHIYFGTNLMGINQGTISVGDELILS